MTGLFRILALPLALAACQQAAEPGVADSWVRLAAVPGRPAGGYLTIRGGPTDATLVGISSPAARRIELHESMAAGGGAMQGMTMRPIGQVAVPAGGTVRFAPGGKHLMIFDVDPGVKPGTTIRLTLTFADGKTLTGDARTIAAGDAAPTP